MRRAGGSIGQAYRLRNRFEISAAAHDALRAGGVAFAGASHRIHTHDDGSEEWMAFFEDPEGNTLALMARVAARR